MLKDWRWRATEEGLIVEITEERAERLAAIGEDVWPANWINPLAKEAA
jgi:hypothetical protein